VNEQAALDNPAHVSRKEALALVTTNLEKLLGARVGAGDDIVAYLGGDVFDLSSKVTAIFSFRRNSVDLFD
jgi:hypothetical protein